ncbi:MAG: cell division protein ZapA [Bacteroidales bacterium]|nr:cell division protein ZapA [Bacteroidales bacterium]MBO7567100.1 cell division protein ZapA [Bacteroidales bacterium]MBP5682975.1 cell division protein ZapA [Bacteroidales bacterium]
MDDKLLIKLAIAGHSYPMKVSRADEERFRTATSLINEKINLYKQKFDGSKKGDFDFLAMVAIDLVSKYIDKATKSDDTEMLSELRIMSNEIDDYIQKFNAL